MRRRHNECLRLREFEPGRQWTEVPFVVIDFETTGTNPEEDRILEIGFEEDMKAIIRCLPKSGRQTALFSATQTTNVVDLARLAIQKKPTFVAAQAASI